MECKESRPNGVRQFVKDLIDTLWNVKRVTVLRSSPGVRDLIDTLWNVKENTQKTR